ncbi:MAG: DUF4920 domain-containing protein [Bacteroidota bacterium]
MLQRISFFAVLLAMLVACNQTVKQEAAKTENETTEKATNMSFGESITTADVISYDQLSGKIQNADSLAVKVRATVNAVCQAKGCWMTLSSPDSKAEEMMVKFKDYGFFVPKDIAGREVIIEGHAFRNVTPVDELRHYAEDAGKSKEEIEKITEPEEELKFIASGVILLPEAAGGK